MLLPLGRLWYDDNANTTLAQKIDRGLKHYADHQGLEFDTVFVHPDTLTEPAGCAIQVIPNSSVLCHHFHFCNLGNGEQAVEAQPAVTRSGG